MPVEVSRIKGRLKELFPKANLSTKRLDEISARLAKKPADDAEDSAIDEVINDANEVFPFTEIAKQDDRIAHYQNNQKKDDPKPADDPKPDPTPEPTPDDVPTWAKGLIDTNKKLLTEVEQLKSGKITENKTAEARKLFDSNETFKNLKEKGKEHYFRQIDVNSETSIEDQIADLEAVHTEIVQTNADSGGYAGKPPAGGFKNEPSKEEIDSVVDDL